MTTPSLTDLIAKANETVRKLGFHIWQSRDGNRPGRFYATRDRSRAEMARLSAEHSGLWAPCGETLDALTLDALLAKIQETAA